MNYLNRSFVGIKVGTKRGARPNIGEIKSGIEKTEPAIEKTSVSGAVVTFELVHKRAEVLKFTLKEVKLLECIDPLDSLANHLELFWASFWVIL